MLHLTRFVQKTKAGQVRQGVKEHYLRDDIECAIPVRCRTCLAYCMLDGCIPGAMSATHDLCDISRSVRCGGELRLDDTVLLAFEGACSPARRTLLFGCRSGSPLDAQCSAENVRLAEDAERYVIVDAATLLRHADLIEHVSVTNVIVPGVVFHAVRGANTSVFLRLKEMLRSSTKHFYYFSNEHCKVGPTQTAACARHVQDSLGARVCMPAHARYSSRLSAVCAAADAVAQ